jgi:hypothetical protein
MMSQYGHIRIGDFPIDAVVQKRRVYVDVADLIAGLSVADTSSSEARAAVDLVIKLLRSCQQNALDQ